MTTLLISVESIAWKDSFKLTEEAEKASANDAKALGTVHKIKPIPWQATGYED